MKIEGSTCSVPADCQGYVSCGLNPAACSCVSGACYYDSSVPPVTPEGCRGCHGTLTNAAPPISISGSSDTTQLGVGAHQSHLSGGQWSAPVPCNTCHLVPTGVDDPGHRDTDLPAEVVFDGLAAKRDTLESSWARDTATCTNYCHGATLTGGTNTTPNWTVVDLTQAACGTCHGLPPGGDHPRLDNCELCHAPTAGPNHTIANRLTHIDGVVQVNSGNCTACHGSGTDPAPPRATSGATATTDVKVGAHQSHLKDGTIRLGLLCSECHLVTSSSDQPGHLGPPTLTWGALAQTGAVTPAWDGAAATCGATYCHGNFAGGNRSNLPVWTQVDGTFSKCDSCHGSPPPAPHPASSSCNTCHPATVTPTGTIDITGGKHLNGVVDVSNLACTSCHGSVSTGRTAPPLGTKGETAVTTRAVGAHDAHLDQSTWRADIACDACHTVPTVQTHATGMSEVAFHGLAVAAGAAPTYTSANLTCANTYCHGATLPGAKPGGTIKRSPVWTQVDGTFNQCGTSCHTNPPGAPHPQSGQCWNCHTAVVDSAGNIANPALHINGVKDVATVACNNCHGGAANDAPPRSSSGATATTDLNVGAHQRHLNASTVARAFPCTSCHVVPQAVTDPSHLDPAPAEVTFGALAFTGGATPAWNRTVATCGNDYCHGSTLTGGTNKHPSWVAVTGAPLGCGACHGNPPPAPHAQNNNCNQCHAQTVTDGGVIIVDGGLHIDGKIDTTGGNTCNSCHGDLDGGSYAPPLGTNGETMTSSPAVGAHRVHLATSTWHRTINCVECHPVPTSTAHSNMVTDFSFTGAATYTRATATCSNMYCHGATLQPAKAGSMVLRSPVWTTVNGSFDTCGTGCHTNPPGGTHLQSSQCAACHAAVIDSAGNIINPQLHINGTVEATAGACNSCHGGSANAAPPVSTTGAVTTGDVAVGAHQRHLIDGPFRKAIACNECHVVPTDAGQAGHLDPAPAEVVFGTLSKTGGLSPTWSRTTATCSNTYCHGASIDGGTLKIPKWTVVDGTQAACGTCHSHPPPAPHPAFTQCHGCHAGTVKADETIDLDGGHINGKVEATSVHPPPATWDTPDSGNFHGTEANLGLGPCTTCHGTTLTGGTSGVSCDQAACHSPTTPNWKTNCVFCHGGTDNATGAPPVDLAKSTATSSVTVGTHTSHLQATHNLSSPISCSACHLVPGDALSPNHIDPRPAEVLFGGLARTGGANPVWARAAATCAASYCHGSFTGGTATNTPVWTNVTGTDLACAKCHPSSPTSGKHGTHKSKGKLCDECHNTITNSAGAAIVTPTLHVNGVKDIRFKGAGTYNPTGKSCSGLPSSGCHGTETW